MVQKSIYSRGGSGMTSGGLDGYLGPEAQDHSTVLERLDEVGNIEEKQEVDCEGKDQSEPLCQIAKAEEAVTRKGNN